MEGSVFTVGARAPRRSGLAIGALMAALLVWTGGEAREAYALLAPGTELVIDESAGTSSNGALFTVDAMSGNRTLLSDFGNSAQGPLGIVPFGVAVTSTGGILVTDQAAGTNVKGALFAVDAMSGNRMLLSDFGNSAQGPLGSTPLGVAVTSEDGILVIDLNAGTNGRGALFAVDATTGNRTVLSDFGNPTQGPLGLDPLGVAITSAGGILVTDENAGTNSRGALFAVDALSGNRTLLSDFGYAAQGPVGVSPFGVAITSAGRIVVTDVFAGTSGAGALFTVDAMSGNRTLLSDFGNSAQGPLGLYPEGVTVTSAGRILVADPDAGTTLRGELFTVDPMSGNRTVVSDFGNSVQGPLGVNPAGVAVVPASDCGDTAGPGGTNVPCSCGSTVMTNTTLVSDPLSPRFDPVTSGTCLGDGLRVAPGVTLDLASRTIHGNGGGIGIDLVGDGSSVRNGKVEGFNRGVQVEAGSGEKVQSVTTRFNTDSGIEVAAGADGTLVRENVSKQNGGSGIDIQSGGDTVVSNHVDSNGVDGIDAETSGTILQNNTGTLNQANGLEATGESNALSGNVMKQNVENGVVATGNGNTLATNQTSSNGIDGVSVSGNTNTLTSNTGKQNGHDGIDVMGTGNVLKGNVGGSNVVDGVVAGPSGNVDQRKNSGSGNGGVQCAINGLACAP